MLLIRTYLQPSLIHGIGLFTAEDITPGTLVWEFHPLVDRWITRSEFETLPALAREMVLRHAEFVASDDAFLLSGDYDKFMNHSSTPNIRDERTRMYANDFIPAHTELTCDYRQVRILDFEAHIPSA